MAGGSVSGMKRSSAAIPTSEALAGIGLLLDGVDHDLRGVATDAERLTLLRDVVAVAGRCTALAQRLAAEAVSTEAAEHAHGTSVGSWLAETVRLTRKEAGALIHAGLDQARFAGIDLAALAGNVLPQQARAMTRVLADLPDDLPEAQVSDGEELLLGYADAFNSAELGTLSKHLLEVLAPEIAEAGEAERLEREYQRAFRDRHLQFQHDGHGTTRFSGSLPTVQAEHLIRVVDAHAAQQKRGLEALDPRQPLPSRAQRRADGLMAMVARHAKESLAPSNGGDRPRIVVVVDYDRLHARCVDARLVQVGEPIAASVLRRLACDADILPAVMGGASEPLDVGRSQRLVTGSIRAALELRDRGCAFPGCDRPPADCHAHHLKPWWAGGATSLSNLVLVCPHHHNIVEPGHDPTAQRWRIRLRADGLPEVIPPSYVDPGQRPRIHTRYLRCGSA